MRRFTSHLAAAALAVATLTPAASVAEVIDREAIGQAIAGAALLGLFGLALREHREDESRDEERPRAKFSDDPRGRSELDAPAVALEGWGPPGQRGDWIPPGHRRDWTPPGHRWEQGRAALPLACLRQHETRRDGPVRLFDGDCLEHRYDDVRALPFDCAILLDDRGRLVSGYVPHCLRAEGYEFADR